MTSEEFLKKLYEDRDQIEPVAEKISLSIVDEMKKHIKTNIEDIIEQYFDKFGVWNLDYIKKDYVEESVSDNLPMDIILASLPDYIRLYLEAFVGLYEEAHEEAF